MPRRKKPSGKGRGAWRWDWKEDEKRSDWTIKKRLEPRYRAATFSQTVLEDVSCNRYTNNTNHSHERHGAFTARPKNTRHRSTMRYFREYVSRCLSCITSIRVSPRLWTIVRLMIRISPTWAPACVYFGKLIMALWFYWLLKRYTAFVASQVGIWSRDFRKVTGNWLYEIGRGLSYQNYESRSTSHLTYH